MVFVCYDKIRFPGSIRVLSQITRVCVSLHSGKGSIGCWHKSAQNRPKNKAVRKKGPFPAYLHRIGYVACEILPQYRVSSLLVSYVLSSLCDRSVVQTTLLLPGLHGRCGAPPVRSSHFGCFPRSLIYSENTPSQQKKQKKN